MLRLPPPIAHVPHAVYWVPFLVIEAHQFDMVVHLKLEICLKVPNTFENIPGLCYSDDKRMHFNARIIIEAKMQFREDLLQVICWLE